MVLERDKRLTIRVSAEEVAMLEALAEAAGVSGSDFLRLHVRSAYAEKFGDKKPKTRK
jgi:hypothetical protein